ncbi:MAG: glycoside hydrolase family 172 protein [Planctomycetota bacterium]
MLHELTKIKKAETGRFSSWDKTGRNADRWILKAGETKVLADIKGPGCITHIWMTQRNHYRECLLKITWDDAKYPSVLCPLGDFCGLGHGIVNSYQSLLFAASTLRNNEFNQGCALNSYVQMPFAKRAVVELINQSKQEHMQYFYIDYETYDMPLEDAGYFHAQFCRENPFGGWGHEIVVNTPEANIANKGQTAWKNNYVILDTKGRGHYIGCNISVTNFQKTWWGEGDDMIWVDGYKWPPDLHGTGSEDYLNQAWGMQDNAFLRNGSSIFEGNTAIGKGKTLWSGQTGGYQTSYVHHIENPVRFEKEIKVTIEHGHGNHLCNEMSSVAYWYADKPGRAVKVPPVEKRMPVLQDNTGNWLYDKKNQITSKKIKPNREMLKMKAKWSRKTQKG